ncbi:MAG: ABC transporter permease subunit [Acidobacteria bacterium]|nr:ABC transporter permease subunit [Acidobacteriota bacterium]
MIAPAILAHERRALLQDRLPVVLLGLFALICLFASLRGAEKREAMEEAATAFEAEHLQQASDWRERVVAVESGAVAPEDDPWAGLAMDVARPAVAAPGPLADFSQGVTAVHPFTSGVSLWRSVDRLFGNYQFQSPNEIRAGSIDLAFAVLFIMPLVMIALAFGALSRDKDTGRLGLLLSHPISVRELVRSKLLVRLGAVFVILVVALFAGLFIGAGGVPGGERLGRFGFWFLAASGYFAFWAGAIYWSVSLNRKSETTAMMMIGFWVLNSLVGPAVLAAAAQLIHPAPSQLAFLSTARAVSNEAYRSRSDVMQGMLLDHPELTVENYTIPEYIRVSYLVTQTVDRSVEPVLDDFEAVQRRRQAFLSLMQYAAPAALAMRSINEISGTDLARQVRFEVEVRDYKRVIARQVEGKVLSGERLTVAEVDAVPSYSFRESDLGAVGRNVLFPIGYLFALGMLAAALARRNLVRLQTRFREA